MHQVRQEPLKMYAAALRQSLLDVLTGRNNTAATVQLKAKSRKLLLSPPDTTLDPADDFNLA